MTTVQHYKIFLADDDEDDCMLFEDALREICEQTELKTANDGEQLMKLLLNHVGTLPNAIFLDLNMPRKNGFECLEEIRANEELKDIPIVIFSTTAQQQSVDRAYERGANFYIQKPGTFGQLKDIIKKILNMNWEESRQSASLEDFFLHSDLRL